MVIWFIINLFLLILIFLYYKKYKKIKFYKEEQLKNKWEELQNKNIQLSKINQEIKFYQNQLLNYQNQIDNNQKQLKILHQEQKELENQLESKENYLNKYFTQIKNNYEQSFLCYETTLDQTYDQREKEFNLKISKLKAQRDSVQKDLDQIKEVYQAATAAKLREQENEQKSSFYKIKLSDRQIADINDLQNFKLKLYNPSIVSKVIWSSYIIKPAGDLCNRVLGNSIVCGIYKITDKITGSVYIGQSKDIASRWKQHIKYGLGIDAPSTNKLYNRMQEVGVWNFTFELLQKCSINKLNEKESFWINMYESNKIGLNSQKGNV